jgi:hypothetical protein
VLELTEKEIALLGPSADRRSKAPNRHLHPEFKFSSGLVPFLDFQANIRLPYEERTNFASHNGLESLLDSFHKPPSTINRGGVYP